MLLAWLAGDDEPKRRHAEYRLSLPDAKAMAESVPYPPLTDQLRSAAGAMVAAASDLVHGRPVMVDQTEQDRRLGICHECEWWDGTQGRCRQCGCFGEWKAWIASQKCRKGKW